MRPHWQCVVVVGWLVSAALGAESETGASSPAKVLAAAVARAERRGWQRAPAETQPAFAPTDAEQQRGVAVFSRNVNLRVFPETVPRPDEHSAVLRAYGAAGETVSVQVAVRALAPLDEVTIRVTDLRGPGSVAGLPSATSRPAAMPLGADRVRCRWVEYAPIRSWGRRRGRGASGQACRVVPLRLRSIPDPGGLRLPANWTQALWLTVSIPATQAPGRYEGRIEVHVAGRRRASVPFILAVLPIRLAEPRSMFFGAFLMVSGPPDGPDVHTVAELKDLADRGIHGILWFWGHYGMAVRRVEGRLKMDFALLDLYMDRVKRAGLKGPVVLALGNDSRGHLEQAIAEIWDLPVRRRTDDPERASDRLFAVGTLDCPQLDALYVEAIRQLLDHAREKRWPEIVLLPYDEPTERLKPEYIHRAGLIKKHFPNVRLYGVVMGRAGALSWLAPPSDVLVTNGNRVAVAAWAREHKKAFWTYGGRCQAAQPFGQARLDYGLRPWATGTQGHWFWAYNWRIGDPLDEFDGSRGDAGWVVAYPPERPGEACMSSPAFEGMRAAVDDVRYAEALGRLLDRLPSKAAQPFRQRLQELRGDILRLRRRASADDSKPPKVGFPTGPVTGYDAFRLRVIGMILEAQPLLPPGS